jgi:thioredoxin 1
MIYEIGTLEDFIKNVEESKGLVFVDFFAQWCGPCKRFAPKLEQISNQHPKIVFYSLDVDVQDLSSVVSKYEISAMPTFILFKDGRLSSKIVGVDETKIAQLLKMSSLEDDVVIW